MKKISNLLLAGLVLCAATLTGCKPDVDPVPTRPTVKFEETEDALTVKAVITSDINLKSVVVSQTYGTGTDAHEDEVENITTFTNAKSYTYQKAFEIPEGYLDMQVVIKAENTQGLSTTAKCTLRRESITMQQVIDAMSAAYKVWEASEEGTMPEEVVINGATLARPLYFEYACRTFLNLYTGSAADPKVDGSYADCENYDYGDTFQNETMSANMMNNLVTKMLNYANNNGRYPNYSSYGSVAATAYDDPDGVKYEGYFTYRRAVVCVARMLDYYKTNSKLANISTEYRIIQEYKPASAGTFTQAALAAAIAGAYAEWNKSYVMPETITCNGTSLTQAQYYYAETQLILKAAKNDTSDIDVLTYMFGEKPGNDSYDQKEIALVGGTANGSNTEDLANAIGRILGYAQDKNRGNGYFANYASYVRGEGDAATSVYFSVNRAMVTMARAIALYVTSGTVPTTVSTEYLEPVKVTIADFAAEMPKLLKAWENNVVAEYVAWTGEAENNTYTNVHRIPDDFTITLNGVDYDKASIYEIGVYALAKMIVSSDKGVTMTDGVGTDELISQKHEYIWPEQPCYEAIDFPQTEVGVNFLVNFASRETPWIENTNNGGTWSRYCSYDGGQFAGYGGKCSIERHLLQLARFYKYLIDNNITKNIYTACKDVKFDASLYYSSAKPLTYQAFAETAVPALLKAWNDNVGKPDASDLTGAPAPYADGVSVHYIPVNYKVSVNGSDYDCAACYAILADGIMKMFVSTDTGGTFTDGIATSEVVPDLGAFVWGPVPYNEGSGNGGPIADKDGKLLSEVPFNIVTNVAYRNLPYAQKNSNTFPNMGGYPRTYNKDTATEYIFNYTGTCCLERSFMIILNGWKYLLDNKITEKAATAVNAANPMISCVLF